MESIARSLLIFVGLMCSVLPGVHDRSPVGVVAISQRSITFKVSFSASAYFQKPFSSPPLPARSTGAETREIAPVRYAPPFPLNHATIQPFSF